MGLFCNIFLRSGNDVDFWKHAGKAKRFTIRIGAFISQIFLKSGKTVMKSNRM